MSKLQPGCEFECLFDADLDLEEVNDPTQVAIYRVVQEGLTNVSKHAANATRVSVSLYCANRKLQVAISDNGPGMPAKQGTGMGLLGMRGRAFAMNGLLVVEPTVHGKSAEGTTVRFELPCGRTTPFCGQGCSGREAL